MLNQIQVGQVLPGIELPASVRQTLKSAQEYLLNIQHPDGHWCGELEGDTILESEYILTMHFVGRSGEDRVRKAANYIRGKQLASGGWAIYEGGPAEVSASAKAYFVLKLLGDDPNAPHMDFVITLCDTLDGQDCPDVGTNPITAAWPLPDPAKFRGTSAERATMINELYGMIRRRLEIFVNLPHASLDRIALKQRLKELGDSTRAPV